MYDLTHDYVYRLSAKAQSAVAWRRRAHLFARVERLELSGVWGPPCSLPPRCDALGRLFTSTGADGPRVRGQLGFAECLANVLH
jgi:hypothetical protein